MAVLCFLFVHRLGDGALFLGRQRGNQRRFRHLQRQTSRRADGVAGAWFRGGGIRLDSVVHKAACLSRSRSRQPAALSACSYRDVVAVYKHKRHILDMSLML